ncbi:MULTISPECIES: ABC transporter permease [Methylobacterium]|uniref:ABC transporter permease n=1 Tax=Methylobacterium TaxID=407 RepID=UPI0006AF3D69|nr:MULTISPECIES: FtsX-like permease family protein [Methylobacterium]MDE3750039.1 FtsX-like permease family protein [Methylobacterium radiotolerans]ONF48640.1 glycosyl transferase family 1 [Methylobacterium radiotolerans]PVY94751.1 putative ABC transport system permease protein [Methylobacterium organophilum]UIY43070.1 FtsX-like permease family protein [Methylobacterium radiotolerans]
MHGTIARPDPAPRRIPLTLRLALRELRAGLNGFAVFLACIALGVMAIAGVASISRSLSDGLGREGRRILGGDLAFNLINREATDAEKQALAREGRLDVVASLRAMAVAPGGDAALVELKAVDPATYPAAGDLATDPPGRLADLLAERDGVPGALADPALLTRLDVKVGDRIGLAGHAVAIRGTIVSEPDKIAGGIGFGPRLMVSEPTLRATGLVQPGSLNRWSYRLILPPGTPDADLDAAQARIRAATPEAGWEIRSRTNADPRFAKSIERFTQFLTLVGLTALIVGGVGVGNAVHAFVERKRPSIATLKSVGAPGSQVVALYLTQVMLIAGLGTLIGLVIGASLPFLLDALFAADLPLPLNPTLAPGELALAAAYGLITAFAFAITPLGRAHDVPVSGLFRDTVDPARVSPRWRYRIWLAASLAALVGLSVATAFDRRVALIFIAAAAIAFGLLHLVALGLMALARRMPHPRWPAPRMALANLHRPGALTPAIVLSLGLGVTLLVTLSLIDANVRRTISATLPARAPNLFFLDIPSRDAAQFREFLARAAPSGKIEDVPMMRGRIVALNGVPASKIRPPEDAAWVLDGDRGITYADTVPDGSSLTEGAWWSAEQGAKPLVSFEADLARQLGLKLGDTVTVNVLGRDLTATIFNLRRVEWRNLGINFVMVFSPGTFRGAPHSDLATLTLPGGTDAAAENRVLRDVAKTFPSVSAVRVKDALDAIGDLVGRLVLAIRGASAVAVLASLFVLAGAIAAGHRARLYDAVVLKVLGASRARLLTAYALEYAALGLATALFGLLAGSLAGWVIVAKVMHLDFRLDLSGALVAAVAAVALAILLGLAGTWRILGQKPAPYLRQI